MPFAPGGKVQPPQRSAASSEPVRGGRGASGARDTPGRPVMGSTGRGCGWWGRRVRRRHACFRCGGVAASRPSGSRVSRQPPSWTARWWARHSRARLARSVGPPWSQWRRWWASHQAGGRSQPATAQPPSRTTRAARWAGVTTRLVRPTSSGWVGAPPRVGGSRVAAVRQPARQAAIVAVASVDGWCGPVAGDQDPGDGAVAGQPPAGLGVQRPGPAGLPAQPIGWPRRLSRSTVTSSWGRTPPLWGSWPLSRVRRASSVRASARRWPPLRASCGVWWGGPTAPRRPAGSGRPRGPAAR